MVFWVSRAFCVCLEVAGVLSGCQSVAWVFWFA